MADALERLGLSRGESLVYRALLRLGISSVGPIARESGISRSKIYEVIEKLLLKGLVSRVFQGQRQRFKASPPTVLFELVEKKELDLKDERKEVERLVPLLAETKHSDGRVVELFEGFNGLKHIREELLASLSHGDELLVLGASRAANELWEKWFIDFHKRREKRGIGMRILYELNAKVPYGEKRKQFKLTQVKYLPSGVVLPTWFDVFKDKVLIVILPKSGKPYALLVRDSAVADSVRAYFELLWQVAKK